MPEKKDPPRNRPSANLGHPVFVYCGDAKDPIFAFVTFEYTDEKHPGYIDACVFPRDGAPRPMQSISPDDYITAHELAELEA